MMLIEETMIAATALPVDQFKAHLHLGTGFADDAAQDQVLESFLRAAIAAVEARTGKILLQRDFTWSVSGWRDGHCATLPVAPVTTLLAVEVLDVSDTMTALPLANYKLIPDGHRPLVKPVHGTLPMPLANGSAQMKFTAGFAATFADLPADLGQAVMLLATHYYENRNDTGTSDMAMPFGVAVLLERYKTLRILGGGAA